MNPAVHTVRAARRRLLRYSWADTVYTYCFPAQAPAVRRAGVHRGPVT